MNRPDGASCAWCQEPAHIKQGRIMLCAMHYRISSMRARAKRDQKLAPSKEAIEAMAALSMDCFGCGEPMAWLRKDGASKQATLQHDRDGAVRLLCLGCNTRHAQHPGDTFYSIQAGQKRCPDCQQVKPLGAFAVDRSRPIGRRSYCRPCAAIRTKKWGG